MKARQIFQLLMSLYLFGVVFFALTTGPNRMIVIEIFSICYIPAMLIGGTVMAIICAAIKMASPEDKM